MQSVLQRPFWPPCCAGQSVTQGRRLGRRHVAHHRHATQQHRRGCQTHCRSVLGCWHASQPQAPQQANGKACIRRGQKSNGSKARSREKCSAVPRTVAKSKSGQTLKVSVERKPPFTMVCVEFNQCKKGQGCQSTSALTLPSRGRFPAYGLQAPLMSNVRAQQPAHARTSLRAWPQPAPKSSSGLVLRRAALQRPLSRTASGGHRQRHDLSR